MQVFTIWFKINSAFLCTLFSFSSRTYNVAFISSQKENGIIAVYVNSRMSSFFQLKQLGHSVDKVEFIVMGGTFMALPEDYRDYFIRNLHDALSGHSSNNVREAVRYSDIH